MTPNEIGARSEGAFLAALIRNGYKVLIPFGVFRYDLAIDGPEGIKRIQVKSGRLQGGAVRYSRKSVRPDTHKTRHYTAAEIDFFGVYCHDNGACYLVPVLHLGSLRCEPTKNRQIKGTMEAGTYLLR